MTSKLGMVGPERYLYCKSSLIGRALYFLINKCSDPKFVLNLLVMKFKSLFLASLFFFVSLAVAQANNLPITVAANERITVTLFFPSEIETVIQPAVNYKFEYEQQSTMGTLVGRKGAVSNLTVITKDGNIFSFLLQYEQEVSNFTYVLSEDQAIGTMDPTAMTGTETISSKTEVASPSENQLLSKSQVAETKLKEEGEKPNSREITTEESLVGQVPSYLEDTTVADFPSAAVSEAFDSEPLENTLYDTDREGYYHIFCENNYDQENNLSKTYKAGYGY